MQLHIHKLTFSALSKKYLICSKLNYSHKNQFILWSIIVTGYANMTVLKLL